MTQRKLSASAGSASPWIVVLAGCLAIAAFVLSTTVLDGSVGVGVGLVSGVALFAAILFISYSRAMRAEPDDGRPPTSADDD